MPPKRKKPLSPKKKRVVSRTAKAMPPVAAGDSAAEALQAWYSPARWNLVLLGIAALLWLYCAALHYPQAAQVFLVLSLLIGASCFLDLKNLKQVLFLTGLGWLLMISAIATNPNFSHVVSFWPGFHLPNPVMTFALGCGLLVAFWRFLPAIDPNRDISSSWAKVWFLFIMGVGFYFRMYKGHEAAGIYWDDCAVSITDARSILEFHERPFLMPIANREPFYCYFLAGLWSFIPNAYAVFVHRLGGALIDLTALWIFYLVGKEAGGRRVGLITAALGAVSKPMIIASVTGNSHVTASLAVGLVMLTTLRLFKNPSWKHFVYWGLALGFAPYNYTSVRPWLLFIVTAVFLWIWFHKQPKAERGKGDVLLGWGTFLAWAFCFLSVNNFLPKDNFLISFLGHAWVGVAVLVGLLSLFLGSFKGPYPSLVPRFFLGVFLAALVVYPLAIQPLIAVHASGLSIFHSHDNLAVHFGLDSFKLLVEKFADSLHTLFVGGEDRGDMNLTGDAFLDYHFIALLALGVVSFLVQPSWMKGFIIVAGLVGISPHVLSIDPHSGKLSCSVAPLAVLAGFGVLQVWQAMEGAFSKKTATFMVATLLVAYFSWAVWGTQAIVLDTFFRGCRVEKTVSLQVKQFSPKSQVYIASYPLFVSFVVQAVMDQGYDVYSLKDHNPIFLQGDESPKDAVVLFHYYDTATLTKITKDYKNVVFDVIGLEGWKDQRPTFRRAVIPASEINDRQDKLFYYQRVPATNWRRDYLVGRYILGYGVIELQESVADPNQPIAFGTGGHMMNLKGDIDLPAESKVRFRVTTNDFVKFQVDGRQVLYLNPYWPPVSAAKTVQLSAGSHHVEYDIWLQHEQSIPKIILSVNDGPEKALGQP